ncbi:nuclear transport factor 2 family protein [Lysobacter sp. 1R34A]|uniref:nuclear transport factor 2 family protein n=1 Tax=Lysobacter sp. 1R34A TaxID=3445786 RepID=UPI003EEF1CD5
MLATVLALPLPWCGAAQAQALPSPAAETSKRVPEASVEDYAAIRRVLERYLQAGREGNSELMRAAFLPQATIHGLAADGSLSGGPIRSLFDYIDSAPAARQLQAQIVSIEIVGTIAQARVESDQWNGARYSDLFQLLKLGGEWKILSKIYHTH